MADLSSRNMRFKEFMLCRSAYWDLGEQIHAGGFCRLGAVPCALAHSGISAASCLSAWLWSLEVHGDGETCLHGTCSLKWLLREESFQPLNSVPATPVPFVFMLFGLWTLHMGAQFSGSPSSGTEGVLLPLTQSMNRMWNSACARAGTWAPTGFCPWEEFLSLNEQGGGRDEEENSTRCYGMSSLQLAARKDKWTGCTPGI